MTTSSVWHREGLLVAVKPNHPWWVSHAQLPTVLPFSDRLWRVYFGARDANNRSRALAVDVDPGDNMRILMEHFDPLLEFGPVGAFDHRGVSPSAALLVDGQVRLYYIGVSVREDVRGQTAIGLAVSDDGLDFRRAFVGPVLGAGPFDPYFATAATVGRESEGYRMWYVGGTEWRTVNGLPDPSYELRVARSADGLLWNPRTETYLALDTPAQAGLGRPWFARTADGLRLWFSRRGNAYRVRGDGAYRLASIGVDEQGAFSGTAEPVTFENPPAPGDFDSWMQAYACVVPHGEDLVMFYNGDDFGREGFGWARLRAGANPLP